MKICGHCKKELPLNKFHINNKSKDGHTTICKDYRRKYVSKGNKGYNTYRKYQNNYQNNYYHKHKEDNEYKEKLKNYRKDFEKKHPNYYKKRNKNSIYRFIYIYIINYGRILIMKFIKLIKANNIDDLEEKVQEWFNDMVGNCDDQYELVEFIENTVDIKENTAITNDCLIDLDIDEKYWDECWDKVEDILAKAAKEEDEYRRNKMYK